MTRPRCSVFCAVSLDGFIARKDGSLDWLFRQSAPGQAGPPPDSSYRSFMDSVDYVVTGRGTFDVVLPNSAEWFYAKPVYVLTHRALPLPAHLEGKVESGAHSPADFVAMMEKRGAKRLYIDGGKTVQEFLKTGLIDDLTIGTMPVLIGEGIPLFAALGHDVQLALESSRVVGGVCVESTYRVVR